MAGPHRWRGSIQVGALFQFPVDAKSATKAQTISLNLHHATDEGSVGRQDYCKACDSVVTSDELIRGYQGKVGVDTDYLKALEVAKSEVLEVEGFVDAKDIDPRWYQKSYVVAPGAGGEKAYALLAAVLERKHKVALGTTAMGGNEVVVAIRPRNGLLAMELLYWSAEMAGEDEASYRVEDVKLSDKELTLGESLIAAMATEFKPDQYTNRLYEAKMEYLDRFLADETPRELPTPVHAAKPTDDLAAALEASLSAIGAPKAKKAKKAAAA